MNQMSIVITVLPNWIKMWMHFRLLTLTRNWNLYYVVASSDCLFVGTLYVRRV